MPNRIRKWNAADTVRFAAFLRESAVRVAAAANEQARADLLAEYGPLKDQQAEAERITLELHTALMCAEMASADLANTHGVVLRDHATTHALQAYLLLTGSHANTLSGGRCDCFQAVEPMN